MTNTDEWQASLTRSFAAASVIGNSLNLMQMCAPGHLAADESCRNYRN
jgi:hypothetical protein